MIKNYILYDEEGIVKQFIRCDEDEIKLYQSLYIEHKEDNFSFEYGYDYKVENDVLTKTKRTDEAFIKEENKAQRITLVSNIEVIYNNIIYQGDEVSQDRMSRAINGLPDDIITIDWKAKDNSSHILNKVDLKQILYLACQEQTKIWFS